MCIRDRDNATRVDETKHGMKMHRSEWEEQELLDNIKKTIQDSVIRKNLKKSAELMQSDNGAVKAANLILELA